MAFDIQLRAIVEELDAVERMLVSRDTDFVVPALHALRQLVRGQPALRELVDQEVASAAEPPDETALCRAWAPEVRRVMAEKDVQAALDVPNTTLGTLRDRLGSLWGREEDPAAIRMAAEVIGRPSSDSIEVRKKAVDILNIDASVHPVWEATRRRSNIDPRPALHVLRSEILDDDAQFLLSVSGHPRGPGRPSTSDALAAVRLLRRLLAAGIAERTALVRLRANFDLLPGRRKALRKAVLNAPRRHERVIAQAIDEFLFDQGMVAFTNVTVGDGESDHVSWDPARDAAARGMPPILIELKQVVAGDGSPPSPAHVAEAAENALKQLREYKHRLDLHFPTDPWAVVFHDSDSATSAIEAELADLPEAQVRRLVLVSLSPRTPRARKGAAPRG